MCQPLRYASGEHNEVVRCVFRNARTPSKLVVTTRDLSVATVRRAAILSGFRARKNGSTIAAPDRQGRDAITMTMSPFRAALVAFGHGEWAFAVCPRGERVQVVKADRGTLRTAA